MHPNWWVIALERRKSTPLLTNATQMTGNDSLDTAPSSHPNGVRNAGGPPAGPLPPALSGVEGPGRRFSWSPASRRRYDPVRPRRTTR